LTEHLYELPLILACGDFDGTRALRWGLVEAEKTQT
jgi:hypothetical protein